jgi:hypothetical protein
MRRAAQLVGLAVVAVVAYTLMKNKRTIKKTRTREDELAFAAELRPIAEEVERFGGVAPGGYKVLPGFKADLGIIHTLHESNAGHSELAVRANNIAGMTGELGTYWRSDGHPYYRLETREWIEASKVRAHHKVLQRVGDKAEVMMDRDFRRYANWRDSYLDLARRIQRPDFAEVWTYAKLGSFKGYFGALQKVGYATELDYAARLENVARGMGLA